MARHEIELVEDGAMDDRPIALRRKRRISSGLIDHDTLNQQEDQSSSADAPPASKSIKTPSKPKKRVRFSDPGPNSSADASSSSTGLTPALKRTSFLEPSGSEHPATPRLLAAKPRRRRSLPALSNSSPSPSLSPPVTPYLSGEIQFAPLRQVLDDRSKRRLRRNNMSEEMNEIDRHMSRAEMREKIQDLENQIAATQQLQSETQDNIKQEFNEKERVQELQQEVARLTEALRARSTTAEPANAESRSISNESPNTSIYQDDADGDFVMVNSDEGGVLRDSTHLHVANAGPTDAASQASFTSDAENEIFRSVRISLEHLFPGEIALGLQIQDPAPLLDTMLDRLRALKTRALIAEDMANTTKVQENNLRKQFNEMLAQLGRARNYAETIHDQTKNEKIRADKAEEQVKTAQGDAKRAEGKAKELEVELDDRQRSTLKLQGALESYRNEVGRLEVLITNMEAQHKAATFKLQGDMDEAVADLECNIAAETLGRRAAEKEASSVESASRDLSAWSKSFEKEQEVGSLNVEIGSLASSLEEAKSDLNSFKAEKAVLQFRIEEEKAAGVKAVEAIQAELARCAEKAEEVKGSHKKDMQSRGAEVSEHKGLLTPVSATRFKDVPGYVEVKRGKSRGRRGDSGVVIMEEEEDEEMLNSDV